MKCIETLVNYGNLEEIDNQLEDDHVRFHLNDEKKQSFNQQEEFQPPNRKVDSEKIKSEFDASQISLKEDWVEWMRKVYI